MPSRAAATEAATSAGPRYVQLADLGIDFVPFPESPSKTVVAAVAGTPGGRGRSPASERLPPGRRGVFVGQLPFGITPERLAFAVNTVLGREAVVMVSVAHRQSCGWVCLDDESADESFARSESAVVEASGLWVARNATQHRQLNDFCVALKARKYGEEILKLQLPKATLTLKPTTASPTGAATAQAAPTRDKRPSASASGPRSNASPASAAQRGIVPLMQQSMQQQPMQQPMQQHALPMVPPGFAPEGALLAFTQHRPGFMQHAPPPQHHFQQQQEQMAMVPCGPPDPATGQQPMMLVPLSSLHQFLQPQQQQQQQQQLPYQQAVSMMPTSQ